MKKAVTPGMNLQGKQKENEPIVPVTGITALTSPSMISSTDTEDGKFVLPFPFLQGIASLATYHTPLFPLSQMATVTSALIAQTTEESITGQFLATG